MDVQKKSYEPPSIKELGSGLLAEALHDVWAAKVACEVGWAHTDEVLWNSVVDALTKALEALKTATVGDPMRERAARVADEMALFLRMRAKVQGSKSRSVQGSNSLNGRAAAIEDVAAAIRKLDAVPVETTRSEVPVPITVLKGPGGLAVYINDQRVAGEKPWGGGTVIFEGVTGRRFALLALLSSSPPPCARETADGKLERA